MKKRELQQLREKDITELSKRVLELKSTIAKLAPKISAGYESNVVQNRNSRRDIAQILSIIGEKQNKPEEKVEKQPIKARGKEKTK